VFIIITKILKLSNVNHHSGQKRTEVDPTDDGSTEIIKPN